jgi:glycosyltransferase involved in cell wall biosynthesis
MRLLIATPLYPPDLGGPATYSKLLEDDFPYPVTIVKFSDVRRYPKVVRHTAYFWNVFRAAKHADVVLALDPVSVGLPALWAAKLRGKPFAVKIVGDYAWEQGTQRFGIQDSLDAFVRRARVPLAVSVLRAIQTHVAHCATAVIVPSSYLKGIIEAWGIPSESIHVIYNAIEVAEGGGVPEQAARAQGSKIVTVGRLVPWKHIDGIIEAVSDISDATLLVVGDGPLRKETEDKAGEQLPGRAIFTGALSHEDTLAVMKQADAFVLNSSYEGLSHVLIEALMLGVPVIATKAGGNPELLALSGNGTLVAAPPGNTAELADAIRETLANPADLGASAGKAQETFSAAVMREKTAQLLSSL